MIKKRLLLLLLPLLFVASRTLAQQELQLSQYMFNGLTLNPALAGSHEAFNAQLMYRQQWVGMTDAPMSYTGSVDGMITQSNSMGWGLSVTGEQMGLMKTLGAYASYAYRMRLNSLGDRLSLGLSVGAMQQNFGGIDFNRRNNQGNPIYHEGDDVLYAETRWQPDFRAGAYYSMGRIAYAGVSVSNLGSFWRNIKFDKNAPSIIHRDSIGNPIDTSQNNLSNPHIYLNLGGHFYIGDKWRLSPSTLVTYPISDRSSLDFNLALTYNDRYWIGAGLRTTLPIGSGYANTELLNSIAIMAEVWITNALRLGYCYDYGIGRVTGVQSGSHEVSLGITLARKITKIKSPREVRRSGGV